MKQLELLNLAGNELLYFSEIDTLSRICSLKHLQLNDPHYGANPICSLSNFHIYSLHKLSNIHSLDGIKIDELSKQKCFILFVSVKANKRSITRISVRCWT